MTGWHADDADLAAVRDGLLTPIVAASVEAHLLACARCRVHLARISDDAPPAVERRARVWDAIADRIDHPSATVSGPWWARVTVGTPALAIVTGLLALALLTVPVIAAAGNARAAVAVLFAVAPLAPVLGAALAYRVDTDPSTELALAAPMMSIRLVLARTTVVLAVALPSGLAAAATLPVSFTHVIGWLLPGLALCGIVLASASRIDPARLGAALAVTWAAVVAGAFLRSRSDSLDVALDHLFVNQGITQVLCGVVVVLTAAFLATNRTAVRTWSSS